MSCSSCYCNQVPDKATYGSWFTVRCAAHQGRQGRAASASVVAGACNWLVPSPSVLTEQGTANGVSCKPQGSPLQTPARLLLLLKVLQPSPDSSTLWGLCVQTHEPKENISHQNHSSAPPVTQQWWSEGAGVSNRLTWCGSSAMVTRLDMVLLWKEGPRWWLPGGERGWEWACIWGRLLPRLVSVPSIRVLCVVQQLLFSHGLTLCPPFLAHNSHACCPLA